MGRAVEQKLGLLRLSCDDRRCALDALLCELGEHGLLIMLGDGDPQIETMLRMVAARHENFLFICGYSPKLADALYHNGDLFLMPSSYEPCGISQMLAMRAGQPCLVHHVGGLRDTVRHGVDGFGFSGESRAAQVTQMLRAFSDVRKLRDSEPARYKQIAKAAAAVRFSWAASAAVYLHNIYRAS